MTGRGRPRRAKSPDTKCAKSKSEEIKHLPQVRYPAEKQNGITKEQKPKVQKKTSHTEGKSSVQSDGKDQTTKHSTEEIKKQQRTPGRAKPAKPAAMELKKTQPDTPNDTTKETPKAKKCVGKAKSLEECPEEKTKEEPESPNDTKKAPIKTTKAKMCAGKPQPLEKTQIKMEPGTLKNPAKVDQAAVDAILYTTLEDLKIKKNDRSEAAKVVNKIKDSIFKHLKENSTSFKEVEAPLNTGSYYENLKISNPDEFDVMVPIPVDRVNVKPFGEDGAFYSVELKRGKNPLKKFQETNTLSASEMLNEFRKEVKKCVEKFPEWEVTRKKKGCPAVTLITAVQSVTISLDVVLCIVVHSSWPPFTKDGIQIDGWLGTKVKREFKMMPYYLVPKYEGKGTVEHDGVLAKDIWRVSFSHVEKAILMNHGSEKTCCEKEGTRCCRKDCLKLLKHLLSRLKDQDSSFDKFCSYHAKTTLLHACCSRTKDSEWRASDLGHCFQLLLRDFVGHLERGVLSNFFIPTQNLLSGPDQKKCNSLARRIRDECDRGFPIFN